MMGCIIASGQASAKFADATQYLSRGADWTGHAAGQKLALSFRVNPPVQTALGQTVVLRNDATMNLQIVNPNSLTGGVINASFYGAGGVTVAQVATSLGSLMPFGVWSTVNIAFDMADIAKAHIRINEAAAGSEPLIWSPYDTTTNTNPPSTDHYLANDAAQTDTHSKMLAEWWEAQNQWLDFSDIANIRKFHRADGTPENLLTDGSGPTGTAPTLYLSGPGLAFGFNRGTGGGMTTHGAITAGTRPVAGQA